jgi:hypothetical protein
MTSLTRRAFASVWLLLSLTGVGFAQEPAVETITLHEGVRLKKLIVTTQGAGIQNVSGTVSRTPGTGPLLVTIPVGTLFVPKSAAQNMVTIAPSLIDLTTAERSNIWVTVACANMRRSIPTMADTFAIEPAPQQEALSKLLAVLGDRGALYPPTQAAVWILTDDATYADLGILVAGQAFASIGGSRMIRQSDAVQAMMAIEQAGLKLTGRRIWKDRDLVCKGLAADAAADLTAWCARGSNPEQGPTCGPLGARHTTTTQAGPRPLRSPGPGKALVYFVRAGSMRGALFQAKLAANSRWIGVLPRGNYYSVAEIDSGPVSFCATGSSFGPRKEGLLALEIEAGKSYYFEARLKTGFNAGVAIAQLDEAAGTALLAKSRLVTFADKK